MSLFATNTDAQNVPPASAGANSFHSSIHDLAIADGKVFAGYGDYNANTGPVNLNSYSIATGAEKHEITGIPGEEIGKLKLLDGAVYAPNIDPRVSWTSPANYGRYDPRHARRQLHRQHALHPRVRRRQARQRALHGRLHRQPGQDRVRTDEHPGRDQEVRRRRCDLDDRPHGGGRPRGPVDLPRRRRVRALLLARRVRREAVHPCQHDELDGRPVARLHLPGDGRRAAHGVQHPPRTGRLHTRQRLERDRRGSDDRHPAPTRTTPTRSARRSSSR